LEKRGEIHKIEGARTMDSLQYWRYMMRLIIATKSTEGIKKNSSKPADEKSGENTLKIMKKKNNPYNLEMRFTHKDQLY
jgi:hypothetical protein